MNIKDPILFYCVIANQILVKIKNSLEFRYKTRISVDGLRLKAESENINEAELQKQVDKQLQEQCNNIKFQSIELDMMKYEQTLKQLKENYQKQQIWIVNPSKERKQIKQVLEKYSMFNLLYEFENYYSLQNCIYVYADQDIQNQLFKMFCNVSDQSKEDTAIEPLDKLDHKIQDLEIISKLYDFEGVELWNCTYKAIPHTYFKCKDVSWIQGMNKMVLHSSHPKTIYNLPLLPPLTILKPNKQHVKTLVNFLQTLHKKYPNHHPTINSILECQGRLYIFTRESWKVNKGWLCYRVAYGDITYQGYLRWLKYNTNDPIAKHHEQLEQAYYDPQVI